MNVAEAKREMVFSRDSKKCTIMEHLSDILYIPQKTKKPKENMKFPND
jgi:hypothetical protein